MFFYDKLFTTIFQPAIAAVLSSVTSHGNIQEFVSDLGFRMVVVEVFLPPVLIEDVIIGKGYLDFKGRTLVRPQMERKEK